MAELAVLVSWYIQMDSQDFHHTFSMALYHKWDVKDGFIFEFQFVMLISESLGGVLHFSSPDIQKFLSQDIHSCAPYEKGCQRTL